MSSRSSIIASVIIVVVVFSTVGAFIFMTDPYVPAQVAVVVPDPGFGDLSMADQVDTGLDLLAGDIVIERTDFEAADKEDAEDILIELSASGAWDLIIVIGGELADVLDPIADTYPNQKYALIGGEVVADNVYSTTYKLHEGAYLAGVLAGLASIGDENRTGTSVVGIIGSVETDPSVAAMIAGFKQGFDYVNNTLNKSITLLPEVYVGSYNDSDTAEELATEMYMDSSSNATIIFAPVRASILGIRNAMILANTTWNSTRQPLAIAAEGDQDYLGLPNIETRSGNSWVVASVVPRSDLAVYQVLNTTLWGEFDGATLDYDLHDDVYDPVTEEFVAGVTLTHSDFIDYDWTPEEIFEDVNTARLMILNGSTIVSVTYPPP